MTGMRVQRCLRRNIPQLRRMRGDILDAVFEMHALVRWRMFRHATRRAAAPSPAGSGAAQSRRRSSGRHYGAWSRRNPHRTCIRRSRSALPSNSAADPCRNIRSSVEVAAPWSFRWLGRGGSSQIGAANSNAESPSIPAIRPRSYRAKTFSGSLALSFSRSSTIEERTCATLWCGISTLLTMSDRLFRSRSTAFNR